MTPVGVTQRPGQGWRTETKPVSRESSVAQSAIADLNLTSACRSEYHDRSGDLTWFRLHPMRSDLHSPASVVDALRAILVVDKLPVGFLLGAGCPASIKASDQDAPLIPAAAGLTRAVVDSASTSPVAESLRRLQAMLVSDGQKDPTIEHMLTRVRAMETVVGEDEVRGFSRTDLQYLEKSICRTISDVVDKQLPESATPYHSLVRWIGQRTNRSFVFTTNYDLLVEQAFEALQVPFSDGFIGSYQPFFDQRTLEPNGLPAHWALVCKLHGSVNWRFVHKRIVRSMGGEGDELLIHPSHLKYTESRRMPYFVMFDMLKAFIGNARKPVALFMIGYSFSDDHVNDAIADSLQANPSAVCYALQYSGFSDYPQITDMVRRCSNLHVLASDEAVTGGRHARWGTCSHEQVDELGGVFRSQRSNEGRSTPAIKNGDVGEVAVESRLGDFEVFGRFLESFSPVKAMSTGEDEAAS